MFACLLLNREVVVNIEWLHAVACKLRRTMCALQSSHHLDQVPAVCVKKCARVFGNGHHNTHVVVHGIWRRPLGITSWSRHPVAT
jgi:hypothetical protein